MQNSGYKHKLTYKRPKVNINSTNINKIKQNRKRQIVLFNPPLNLKMKTKIRKLFLNLSEKHFPPHNKLHKLFNRININIDCDIIRYKQKCYLGSCEITSKDCFGNHKTSLDCIKHKNDRKIKSTMEHQKLHEKLSKCVVLTIQIVNAAFYV